MIQMHDFPARKIGDNPRDGILTVLAGALAVLVGGRFLYSILAGGARITDTRTLIWAAVLCAGLFAVVIGVRMVPRYPVLRLNAKGIKVGYKRRVAWG
ncbi:MAG: hypothetical protein Q4A82_01520 [Corynebacterium sp.]|nr:hypothetical protein [Corynebacterium sp.]